MFSNVLFTSLLLIVAAGLQAQPANHLNFDDNWKFYRGGAQGAENAAFSDAAWRSIDLPHDFSIEDAPGTQSPFSLNAVTQVSGGFTNGGTGWYRKSFGLPTGSNHKIIELQFDGVYMNADVWVNGKSLGNHPYGYTSFKMDITPFVNFDGPNLVAVEVKNEGQNSRWYAGSGIYRHVWLNILEPVHTVNWGTYITTPAVSAISASVNCKTAVVNESEIEADITVVTTVMDPAGKKISGNGQKQKLSPRQTFEFSQLAAISKPVFWSCDSPVLYSVATAIYNQQNLLSSDTNYFGIRTIAFDAVNGFQLNGKTLKMKGGCFHHDNGPLGTKAYDRAEERKVELLKASGYNALRCSHNPPSQAFLNACDRLGMLVIDESFDMWNYGKNPYDYHLYFKDWWKRDIASMVLRDRNHPSIVLWSIGNEIPERGNAEGVATAKLLADYVKSLDSSRPVTAAVNGLSEDKDPFFAELDVAGYNYAAGGDHGVVNIYQKDHQRVPQRVMIGTESYPLDAFESWMDVVDNAYVAGDFVWTAFDYIGEASIGWLGYFQSQRFYPWNLAFCGDIDICGWKRPQSYYRDALWKNNQIAVFVTPPTPSFDVNPNRESWSKWHWLDAVANWNWAGYEEKPLEVDIYSSCSTTELFLNGKSLGRKPVSRASRFTASWQVPYHAGELKAVGYNEQNRQVNSAVLTTAKTVVAARLSADRTVLKADNQDLAYITVELVDDKGNRHPLADNLVDFSIEGPGAIVGVGNANPKSLESYQLPRRQAWEGRCLVIVKAGKLAGEIKLNAQVAGLPTATLILKTQ